MPVVRPFKGLRYNKEKIKNIADVVAPPYDVIPPEMQGKLYARDSRNVVRLILGKIKKDDNETGNRYTRAGDLFKKWVKDDMLSPEKKKAVYIYAQRYSDGARSVERIGFMALMSFEKGRKDKVLPHENTLLKPKIDRLNLLREVKANLSPIFVMYDDTSRGVLKILKKWMAGNKPVIDISYDGVREMVWALDDEKDLKKIERLMAGKDIFIADGHHRYEVTRNFHDEIQTKDVPLELKENSGSLLTYFVGTDEEMLTVYPTHRLIKDPGYLTPTDIENRLKKYFLIYKAQNLKKMLLKLDGLKRSTAFGIYLGKGLFYVIKLKNHKSSDAITRDRSKEWKRLDVTILHSFVMKTLLGIRDDDENMKYVKDAADGVKYVDRGGYKVAFFLNATKVSQVKRIAKLGEKMPKKATYFYPKLLTGLVINKLY